MSSPSQTVYCIDTSALVDMRIVYPLRNFPSVWEKFRKLVQDKRLISPNQVFKEVEKRDDELRNWTRQHRQMFGELNQQQQGFVKEILQKFPNLINSLKTTEDADPFVIAPALSERKKQKQDLFKREYIVVAHEKQKKGGRPKISDVCTAYGIKCIWAWNIIENEGWKFQ